MQDLRIQTLEKLEFGRDIWYLQKNPGLQLGVHDFEMPLANVLCVEIMQARVSVKLLLEGDQWIHKDFETTTGLGR